MIQRDCIWPRCGTAGALVHSDAKTRGSSPKPKPSKSMTIRGGDALKTIRLLKSKRIFRRQLVFESESTFRRAVWPTLGTQTSEKSSVHPSVRPSIYVPFRKSSRLQRTRVSKWGSVFAKVLLLNNAQKGRKQMSAVNSFASHRDTRTAGPRRGFGKASSFQVGPFWGVFYFFF